nr:META domain-containing protein [Propionicimonas sp.]
MKAVRVAATVLLSLVALLFTACSVVDWGDGGRNDALDMAWALEAIDLGAGLSPAQVANTPTMVLDAGAVAGNAGVNTFAGDYTWNRDGSFSFGELSATEMAGEPAAMAQEQAFFDALSAVRRFDIGNTKLMLSDAEGRVLLVFAPA